MEPGDVILVLQQKEHEVFTREGDDLFMTKKLHLAEALCGFHMVVKHLDKRNLIIKYPAGQVIEPGVYPFRAADNGRSSDNVRSKIDFVRSNL